MAFINGRDLSAIYVIGNPLTKSESVEKIYYIAAEGYLHDIGDTTALDQELLTFAYELALRERFERTDASDSRFDIWLRPSDHGIWRVSDEESSVLQEYPETFKSSGDLKVLDSSTKATINTALHSVMMTWCESVIPFSGTLHATCQEVDVVKGEEPHSYTLTSSGSLHEAYEHHIFRAITEALEILLPAELEDAESMPDNIIMSFDANITITAGEVVFSSLVYDLSALSKYHTAVQKPLSGELDLRVFCDDALVSPSGP